MKNSIYILSFMLLLFSCKGNEKETVQNPSRPIEVTDGTTIVFPDETTIAFFETERVGIQNIDAELHAPGKIAATVLPSGEGANQNIILFNNPELSGNYTELIQHQINISQIQDINIKQKELELERAKDLNLHGAVTGQELLNAQTELSMAQTNLANEKAALIEHETILIAGGFNPEILRRAKAGTAYVICDIPENLISKITEGQSSTIVFTAFPNEEFVGKIDAVADMLDNVTRMVKVRISVNNSTRKLKSGMFADVSFRLSEGDFINIDKYSLVTVQGKHYVFVKTAPNEFERKELKIGQQIGDRVIVFSGLDDGDEIAIEGVMQLKGLSFGY